MTTSTKTPVQTPPQRVKTGSLLSRLTRHQIFIPIAALLILVVFNLIADPSFFAISLDHNSAGNPVLSGYLITILDNASELVILAIGMTLVTAASGGQDISVGAAIAIGGSVVLRVLCGTDSRPETLHAPIMVICSLALVWLCFGLWHGFEWTFLVWGVWNFAVLLSENSFRHVARIPGGALRRVYTLLTVAVGFVLLKSPTLYHAGQFFIDLLGFGNNAFSSGFFYAALREYWAPLFFGVLFVTPVAARFSAFLGRRGRAWRCVAAIGYAAGLAAMLVLCLAFLAR